MRHLIASAFFSISFLETAAQENNGSENFAPTNYPDRIMMTIPGNPATSRAVSWRTVYGNTNSVGEIALLIRIRNWRKKQRKPRELLPRGKKEAP